MAALSASAGSVSITSYNGWDDVPFIYGGVMGHID